MWRTAHPAQLELEAPGHRHDLDLGNAVPDAWPLRGRARATARHRAPRCRDRDRGDVRALRAPVEPDARCATCRRGRRRRTRAHRRGDGRRGGRIRRRRVPRLGAAGEQGQGGEQQQWVCATHGSELSRSDRANKRESPPDPSGSPADLEAALLRNACGRDARGPNLTRPRCATRRTTAPRRRCSAPRRRLRAPARRCRRGWGGRCRRRAASGCRPTPSAARNSRHPGRC